MPAQTDEDPGQELTRQKLRAQVVTLRTQGVSLRQVGEQLGISHETVRRHEREALDELRDDCEGRAGQLRALEGARLDRAHANAIYMENRALAEVRRIEAAATVPAAAYAKWEAAHARVLAVAARRSRLFGLDESIRHKITADFMTRLMGGLGSVVMPFVPRERRLDCMAAVDRYVNSMFRPRTPIELDAAQEPKQLEGDAKVVQQ
jgi:hypothetical protein